MDVDVGRQFAGDVRGEPTSDEADETDDADAIGFSTGETDMTAWVVRVLFRPINAPETITATMRVVFEEEKMAMTKRSMAKKAKLAYRVFGVPKRD